jgi:hypothetical protein
MDVASCIPQIERPCRAIIAYIYVVLAEQGWVGVSINYRLYPDNVFPTYIIDCKRALQKVRVRSLSMSVHSLLNQTRAKSNRNGKPDAWLISFCFDSFVLELVLASRFHRSVNDTRRRDGWHFYYS